MMSAISTRFLRKFRRNVSGNTTMLVAFGMPALIGGAGLATDFSQYYMWKREMQHAADQAAIAGAFALAGEKDELYADRAAQEFAHNLDNTTEFVSDPTINLVDYAGGENNAVAVTATASRSLPFSSFLTRSPLVVSVSAQATWRRGDSFAACVKALATDGVGVDIHNGATVNARCGIAALSCDNADADGDNGHAIVIGDNATIEADSIAACGSIQAPDGLAVHEGVRGLEDEFADLPTPQPQDPRRKSLDCSKGKVKVAAPAPGVYSSFVAQCNVTMAPGIYVIDGGVLDLSTNYSVTGTGIMFVLKNGAQMKLGGTGNAGPISLTPITASQMVGTVNAPYAERYQGILVFEDKSNTLSGGHKHIINGNTQGTIEGLIYTPRNTMRINGGARVSGSCLLLSANRVEIGGNAHLNTFCPTDDSLSGGYVRGGVRLVA